MLMFRARDYPVKFKKTLQIPQAFVITEANLMKLDRRLAEFGGPVKYKAKTKDDFEIECETVDVLVREASLDRSFTDLHVYVIVPDANIQVFLRQFVYFVIEANETEATKFEKWARLWAAEIKPWYSWLANPFNILGIYLIMTSIFLIVSLISPFWSVFIGEKPSSALNFGFSEWNASSWLRLLIELPVFIAFQQFLFRAIKRNFPMITFAIGQGLLEYNKQEAARHTLRVVFLVIGTILTGLLTALLARSFIAP